jgi:hypothetical protein
MASVFTCFLQDETVKTIFIWPVNIGIAQNNE